MGSNHQLEEDITNILEQHPNWKSVGMGGNHRIQNIFKFFFSLLLWLRQTALAWSKWNLKRDSMIYVVMKFGLARILVSLLQRKLEGVHSKILWLDPHKTLIVELWLRSLLVLTLSWMRPNMLY
ncbi:uncharacterized protein LOC112023681 isoform X1 [Quercus suber]|uniref:uncharacterized protein LOC112023681 isoform X1 n=2 Tax=Quercus suber TaxID=58331 RepID=UPI000D2720BC|nr:hypothetical protein CFP56_03428 [Quercus suber]